MLLSQVIFFVRKELILLYFKLTGGILWRNHRLLQPEETAVQVSVENIAKGRLAEKGWGCIYAYDFFLACRLITRLASDVVIKSCAFR